jgi:hypothetical protein
MTAIDRRTLLRDILPGAAVVTIGVATASWAITTPNVAQAVPLAAAKISAAPINDVVERVQVRRRRRWVCWWSRSRRRRVCGWRWV